MKKSRKCWEVGRGHRKKDKGKAVKKTGEARRLGELGRIMERKIREEVRLGNLFLIMFTVVLHAQNYKVKAT